MNESNNAALACLRQIEPICAEFEQAWRAGRRPVIRKHLAQAPEAFGDRLLVELVRLDVEYRRRAGESAQEKDYLAEFPELALLLAATPSAASNAPAGSLPETAEIKVALDDERPSE